MSLEIQKQELQNLGFKILQSSPDKIIATRKQWYLDCMFTRMSQFVFIHQVDKLTKQRIETDRQNLEAEARKIDDSLLPRGFQKGNAVFSLYFAEEMDEESKKFCHSSPAVRFAHFYLPAAYEKKTNSLYYLQHSPIWGFLFYPKFRYLIRRLLHPQSAPTSAPISWVGLGFDLFLIIMIAFSVLYWGWVLLK